MFQQYDRMCRYSTDVPSDYHYFMGFVDWLMGNLDFVLTKEGEEKFKKYEMKFDDLKIFGVEDVLLQGLYLSYLHYKKKCHDTAVTN